MFLRNIVYGIVFGLDSIYGSILVYVFLRETVSDSLFLGFCFLVYELVALYLKSNEYPVDRKEK